MNMQTVPVGKFGMDVQQMILQTSSIPAVRKSDLCPGDVIVVNTSNSEYTIRVLGGSEYSVSGGWFDRKGQSPLRTSIAGCTWGGSVIRVDVIAACGLCIEFGNRVRTSVVRRIAVFPSSVKN